MAVVAGSVLDLIIAGRVFAVPADNDSGRKLGGTENEVVSNGDGSARIIKSRVPLNIDSIAVSVDDDRGDQQFLQDISNGNDFVPVNVTYASGDTWQGSAIITGELSYSSANGIASFGLMGPGELTKQ